MKKSISKRLLSGLIVFTLLLAVGICAFAAMFLRRRTLEKYEYVGSAITGTIADRLDGDKVMSYLDTGVPDEYYYEVLSELDVMHSRFDPLYIYVAIPEDDYVLYIWCNGFYDGGTIGYTTEYAPGGKAWMQGILHGENVEPLCFASDPEFGEVATSASPIYDSKGEPVALVLVDFSTQEISVTIVRIVVIAMTAVIGLLAIYIAIYYIYVQRQLVKPIGKLTKAARELTENLDEEHVYVSDIRTGDELEALSKAFAKMNIELRDYIRKNMKITAERERLGAELDTAASIQRDQLPGTFPAFPDRNDFDIYASMNPAKTVGGDFYDFFMVDDDHIALVMADVSGKGIPAALFMMISKMLIMNHIKMGQTPAQALTNVNLQLMESNAAHQFVTVWLAVIDLKTGKGIATNAGHEHPVLRRAGGIYELVKYKHSAPVAAMKKTRFTDHEFELCPGDSLFIYTDGVTEAANYSNELFGTDRMLRSLNLDPGAKPRDVLENVMNGINGFVLGAEQFDDITMLCFKYIGQKGMD